MWLYNDLVEREIGMSNDSLVVQSRYTLPKIGTTVSKTYTICDPSGRVCLAEILVTHFSPDGDEPSQEPCCTPADLGINIDTITMSGKHNISRIGFCTQHIPRKYRDWFKIRWEINES